MMVGNQKTTIYNNENLDVGESSSYFKPTQ